ncbi:MAG: YfhO family protein [Marvinbryantia sp.]|jgi:uncharacterized membrane protein YfhO
MRQKKEKAVAEKYAVKKLLFLYSVSFCILAFLIYLEFILNKKSLVWLTDAKGQYLIYYEYMGKYLRELLRGFLHGNFSVPLYDFTIGMGEDINAVIRTNLTDFLSAFVPSHLVEPVYNFWMLVRLYAAGLAFLAYGLYRKFPRVNLCPAALIYVFCGYTLNLGSRHPDFTAPMIFLPLLLLAMERLIKQERYWGVFYSGMVALSLTSSYYFLYMNTLAMGIYALVRFGTIFAGHKKKGREFLRMMGRISSSYLLGCLMAMVFFLPQMYRLFSSMRMSSGIPTAKELLFYDGNRALALFMELIGGGENAGASTFLGFSLLVIPVLIVVFARRWREQLPLKITILIVTAVLMFPVGGYLMSGFSAFNNRWTYIAAFVVAVAAAVVIQDIFHMTVLQMVLSAVVTVGYWYATQKKVPGEMRYFITASALVISMAVLIAVSFWDDVGKQKSWKRMPRCGAAALLTLTIATTALNGYLTFSPKMSTKLTEYADQNSVMEEIKTSTYQHFANATGGELARCDTHLTGNMQENYPISLDYMGTSIYNSVLNANLVQYHTEMENIGISAIHRIFSLDGRTALEALSCTEYYLTRTGQEIYVPYGFVRVDEWSDDGYSIYKNKYLLPFGYVYENCVTEADCAGLDGLEKQQLMLQTAIVEKIPDEFAQVQKTYSSANLIEEVSKEIMRVPVKIIGRNGSFKMKGNLYHAQEENSGFVLAYPKKAGYEAYLHFKNLNRNVNYAMVGVQTSDLYKEFTVRGKERDYSLGREDYLVNLGYSEKNGEDQISVIFRKKGNYHLTEMELCYVPMKKYGMQMEKLGAEGLKNIKQETNGICGEINLEKPELMVFSVPYRRGWKLFVDGQEQECFRTNVTYIGAVLPAGVHEIKLCYCTAGIRTGLLLSVIGLTLYIGLILICRSKYRHQDADMVSSYREE